MFVGAVGDFALVSMKSGLEGRNNTMFYTLDTLGMITSQ